MKTFPPNKLTIHNSNFYVICKIIGGLLMFWLAYDFWTINSWFWYFISILFLVVGSYYLYCSSMELITRKAILILSPKGILVNEKQFFLWEEITTEIRTEQEGQLFRFFFRIFSSPSSTVPYQFLMEVSIDGIDMSNNDLEAAIQFYRRGGEKQAER